ncbi:DUF58 domain-containing protein [Xanthobacter agilis]|uniref:DUF58 domain-containing protein n=1 Tax=Xanthobacter agilis TaxID=47492 RepID=UPI0037291D91
MSGHARAVPPEPDERPIPVLPYGLHWRPRGHKPGAHPADGRGGDGAFQALAPLLSAPDPRRIDIRASIRDPFEAVHVRTFAPRRSITVTVMVDLSSSMGFGDLKAEVAQCAATIAAAAGATADAFSLIAADAAPRPDLFIPPTRRRGLPREIRDLLTDASCAGRSARGLVAAAENMPRGRGLVFLVSDFLMPEDDIAAVLDALFRHDVIPVVVRDSRAEGDLPRFGLLDVIDAESGRRRLVFMRPRLRARWLAQAERRRSALESVFASRGVVPFFLTDRFDADALLDHLARR